MGRINKEIEICCNRCKKIIKVSRVEFLRSKTNKFHCSKDCRFPKYYKRCPMCDKEFRFRYRDHTNPKFCSRMYV